jgi:hypothetical protein
MLTEFQVRGKPSDNSSALAKHRAHVYQTTYLEILRSVIGAAGRGEAFAFNDGSPFLRLGVFNILVAIMDYEEAYVITLSTVSFFVNPYL